MPKLDNLEHFPPLRRFYRTYLNQFAAFRLAKRWLLQLVLHPLGRVRLWVFGPQTMTLLFLDDVAQQQADCKFIALEKCVVWPKRRFVGLGGRLLCLLRRTSTLRDASRHCFFQEEVQGCFAVSPGAQQAIGLMGSAGGRLAGRWASICHPASENWMHWLAEVLPLLVCLLEVAPPDTGIMWDEGLSRSAQETFSILAGEAKAATLPAGSSVVVDELIVPDTASFGWSMVWPRHVPPAGEGYKGEFAFDEHGLRQVRRRLLQHFTVTPQRRKALFIRRVSHFRTLPNELAVLDLLAQRGFEPVEPGALSLAEQVRLFSSADVVVAQGGAALANIMFMPEGSTVICLMADSPWVSKDYFRRYAEVFGVNLIACMGALHLPDRYRNPVPATIDHPMNAEFVCDIARLAEALDDLQPLNTGSC